MDVEDMRFASEWRERVRIETLAEQVVVLKKK